MEDLVHENVIRVKAVVDTATVEAHSVILKCIFQYKPEERWLIYGRILNILYSNHYRTSIAIGNSQLDKVELAQGKDDQMAKKLPAKKAKKKVAKKGY